MIGVYAGSFCPITVGHVDAIERASKTVDKLYVVVGVNVDKKYALTNEQRLELTKKALEHLPKVEVCLHEGMMTDFCKSVNADVMIKSIRNVADLQQALDIAGVNRLYWHGETTFIVGDAKYQHVSSSLVRELVGLGQDVSALVPQGLCEEITKLLLK